jgi:hypothetical protein
VWNDQNTDDGGHMISIRFSDDAAKRRALGYQPGRFSFRSFATGAMIVPPEALGALAVEGIAFIVEGPATYEQYAPQVRVPAAAPVQ